MRKSVKYRAWNKYVTSLNEVSDRSCAKQCHPGLDPVLRRPVKGWVERRVVEGAEMVPFRDKGVILVNLLPCSWQTQFVFFGLRSRFVFNNPGRANYRDCVTPLEGLMSSNCSIWHSSRDAKCWMADLWYTPYTLRHEARGDSLAWGVGVKFGVKLSQCS